MSESLLRSSSVGLSGVVDRPETVHLELDHLEYHHPELTSIVLVSECVELNQPSPWPAESD